MTRERIEAARQEIYDVLRTDPQLFKSALNEFEAVVRADVDEQVRALGTIVKRYEADHDEAEWNRTNRAFGICRCDICKDRSSALVPFSHLTGDNDA